MIHRNKGRKLKRTASHRKSTLSNLSVSLINHKKITTTLAKAKELRTVIEPLITKAKKAFLNKKDVPNAVHLRRQANKFLNDKGAIKTLFDEIGSKVSERNGGYTRVLKIGRRLGDAAELAIIELVDYNVEQAEQKQKDKPAAASTGKVTVKKTAKSAGKKVKKESSSKSSSKSE